MIKKILRQNKLVALVIAVYLGLLAANQNLAFLALNNSTYYLKEMAQILPVIFMLTVAIDVLIPKELIARRLGKKSGGVGVVLALAFGSLSAGPIYAAFPIAKTLHKKGASVGNVVIILSAWAVIKVPMLANEAKFLGPEFMVLRWVLTVAFILAIAFFMEKIRIPIQGAELESSQGVAIRQDYCIGCQACVRGMPELFAMKDAKAYILNPEIDIDRISDLEKDKLNKVAGKCPTKAIELENS